MGHIKERIGLALAGGIFRLALYACLALGVLWLARYTYGMGYDVFNQQAMSPGNGKEVTVVIPENSTTYEIGTILQSQGLIKDARVFWVQEKLSLFKDKLQPGTYRLSTAYTPNRMMEIMSESAPDEE